ncbi:unnamed protein product [Effrenium voratum]|nr:unnamed protein product [Effrenium voratum]
MACWTVDVANGAIAECWDLYSLKQGPMGRAEAVAYFKERSLTGAAALLASRVTSEVPCYQCRGVLRLNLFPVHERAAALKAGTYNLVHYREIPGFVAAYTKDYELQSALLSAHVDHKCFCKAYQVRSVGELNGLQQVGRGRKDFVLACEFRQECKISEIIAKARASRALRDSRAASASKARSFLDGPFQQCHGNLEQSVGHGGYFR